MAVRQKEDQEMYTAVTSNLTADGMVRKKFEELWVSQKKISWNFTEKNQFFQFFLAITLELKLKI